MTDERRRARELGITVGEYRPGALNAITDVAGVEVGHTTVNWGDASLPDGHGPSRSGVTAIWPARDVGERPVAAGVFAIAGTGEMTGRSLIEELGQFSTPIVLTNTMSVGIVYDATCRYLVARGHVRRSRVVIPVVAECDDSDLHDAHGFHITREHVWEALDRASSGPVAEGCVGAGTGMHCFEFKGGIGTASRRLPDVLGGWTVGVLVQTNFGRRPRLTVAGIPVGHHMPLSSNASSGDHEQGSGIVVVATDAPLDGRQLARVARRAALGLGRTGSTGGHGSGELLLAFSTAFRPGRSGVASREMVEGDAIDPIFGAAVESTEEGVLNALCMATTTDGRGGHVLEALPLDQLSALLRTYGRLDP
jgi:D-aminopeptidase